MYRDARSTEKKKVVFMNFSENRAVYEIMWTELLYSQTGHRGQCSTAHAHWMLDN